MTCPICNVKTKRLRYSRRRKALIVCQVCKRKEDGKPWKLFRLLQIFRVY